MESIQKIIFGKLEDGSEICAWKLCNSKGMEIEIIEFGATLRSVIVPTKTGEFVDVVLGFDHLAAYEQDEAWIGAIAGRVSGRITDGIIKINGMTYSLPINNPPNHLHGGPNSFNRKRWKGEAIHAENAVRMKYLSPDGENGYPGELDVVVTYQLTEDNEIIFITEAKSSQSTPVSITQHSYFQLSGEGKGDIMDHRLAIFSDTFVPSDENGTLSNQKTSVKNTPSDLQQARRLEEVIPYVSKRHIDHYWFGENGLMKCMAQLTSPKTGITMTVYSDHDCLQGYSAVALNHPHPGKSGALYGAFAGLCLEAHAYPNATTVPGFGDIFTKPYTIKKNTARYRFGLS